MLSGQNRIFYSTKLMTGFSCAFRQWRAESHCRFNHGYDLSFKFIFASRELDIRNWAVDFGSLKSLKAILEDAFDHKTVIAKDDPLLEYYKEGAKLGAHQLRILPKSGCEAFAYYVFEITEIWLRDNGYYPRCWVKSVEVRENASNSAIYEREDGPSLSDRMGKLLTTKMEDCDADVERRTGRTT